MKRDDRKSNARLVMGSKIRALHERLAYLGRNCNGGRNLEAVPFSGRGRTGDAVHSVISRYCASAWRNNAVLRRSANRSEVRAPRKRKAVLQLCRLDESVCSPQQCSARQATRRDSHPNACWSAAVGTTTHAGEEFLHVLSNQVSLNLEGRTFVLDPGDSAHFESTAPHGSQSRPSALNAAVVDTRS
ncbi:Cupin 2 conserved barrel domain protein [Paraburkholderia atlantica]|uniref:Cupin 2 conserved barrel domain protein n=1 Tax=Paraburkholderia atlantica TaxID=2654982 RepID=D5WK80_PARAM|nr:Cupin 2 conserved barrel domain protein [Paraburkholderia atlantica]